MQTVEDVALWSVRISGGLLALAALARLGPMAVRSAWLQRALWSAACLLLVLHEAAALQAYFAWDQHAAWQHVAVQSREFAGFNSGVGLIVNYAAAAIWFADVAWWWIAPARRAARARWLGISLWGFLATMFFFGAVAFATGWTRVIASGLFVLVAIAYLSRVTLNRSRNNLAAA